MARIRPMGEFVLVERRKAEKQTPGGLFIPDAAQEKAQRGVVLAVGLGRWSEDGTRRIEPAVKKGDVVVLPQWAGAEDMGLKSGMLLVRESELLGVEE